MLSHLGSGSEIALADYRAAIDGTPASGDGFNESIWDRWNAMSPQDQAAGYLQHNEILVATLEALTPQQRETVQVKLGFLPAPLPLALIAGMRLNETTLHEWDVNVAFDPAAGLPDAATQLLAEQFSDGLSFLAGFIGKPQELGTTRSSRSPGRATASSSTTASGSPQRSATPRPPSPGLSRRLSGCWPAG